MGYRCHTRLHQLQRRPSEEPQGRLAVHIVAAAGIAVVQAAALVQGRLVAIDGAAGSYWPVAVESE